MADEWNKGATEREPSCHSQISHPAVQLAWRRAKAGSRPGQRTDNAKLGLVIEGGGMRGVISAGSLMMLYELGLRCSPAVLASLCVALCTTKCTNAVLNADDRMPEWLMALAYSGCVRRGSCAGTCVAPASDRPRRHLSAGHLLLHIRPALAT